MLTLGIDTSTRVCSVAVAKDDKILGAVDINVGLTHSEGLVPQLEQLLTLAQVTKEELELIAVSRVPVPLRACALAWLRRKPGLQFEPAPGGR